MAAAAKAARETASHLIRSPIKNLPAAEYHDAWSRLRLWRHALLRRQRSYLQTRRRRRHQGRRIPDGAGLDLLSGRSALCLADRNARRASLGTVGVAGRTVPVRRPL